MGASLLANAVCQHTFKVSDPAHSRAGSLPQGNWDALSARMGIENARHLLRLAVEVRRRLQPALIRVPRKHELAILQPVDHLFGNLWPYRRAALAAADAPLFLAPQRVYVTGGVNDDGAIAGLSLIHI